MNNMQLIAAAGVKEVVRCKDCKYLEVVNGAEVYAVCARTDFEFMQFGTGTNTHFCAYGTLKEKGVKK